MAHAKVVNDLWKNLKHKGFDAYNDKYKDLFIRKNKEITKLFEIKTSICSSSLQKGIGQLILYSLDLSKKPDLFLVLPRNLDSDLERKLKNELNIEILVYKKKKNTVTFPKLKELINKW